MDPGTAFADREEIEGLPGLVGVVSKVVMQPYKTDYPFIVLAPSALEINVTSLLQPFGDHLHTLAVQGFNSGPTVWLGVIIELVFIFVAVLLQCSFAQAKRAREIPWVWSAKTRQKKRKLPDEGKQGADAQTLGRGRRRYQQFGEVPVFQKLEAVWVELRAAPEVFRKGLGCGDRVRGAPLLPFSHRFAVPEHLSPHLGRPRAREQWPHRVDDVAVDWYFRWCRPLGDGVDEGAPWHSAVLEAQEADRQR